MLSLQSVQEAHLPVVSLLLDEGLLLHLGQMHLVSVYLTLQVHDHLACLLKPDILTVHSLQEAPEQLIHGLLFELHLLHLG